MTKKVVILYEHINRELYTVIKLKELLEKKYNMSVSIFSITFEFHKAVKESCDLLIIPWCYDENDVKRVVYPFYKSNNNIKVVNMHFEQLGTKDSISFLMPKDDFSKNSIYHLTWGNYFAENLSKLGIKPNRIYIVGNSRTDELFNNMTNMKKDDIAKKYNLDPKKKWILYADNLAGFSTMSDKEIKALSSRGYKNISEFVLNARKTLTRIINILNKIYVELKDDYEIIFRPHPGHILTNKELNKNILVNNDFTIREWLDCIDLLLVWNSTSVFEGIIKNTKVLRIEPIKIPEKHLINGMKIIPRVKNVKELKAELLSNEKFICKKELEYIFGPIDGLVVERMAYVINIISTYEKAEDLLKYKYRLKDYYWVYKYKLANILGSFFIEKNLIDKIKLPKFQYRMNKDYPLKHIFVDFDKYVKFNSEYSPKLLKLDRFYKVQ